VVFTRISRRTRAEARVEHRSAKAAGKPNQRTLRILTSARFPSDSAQHAFGASIPVCLPAMIFPAANLGFVFSIELGRTPCGTLEKATEIEFVVESDLVSDSLRVAKYEATAILRCFKILPE